MRKILTFILTTVLLSSAMLGFAGCSAFGGTRTDGYFIYQRYGSGKDRWVSITGLSDLGKKQRFIIIPEEIKGMQVSGLRGRGGLFSFGFGDADFESDTLEKFFFTTNISISVSINDNTKVFVLVVPDSIRIRSSNLEHFFVPAMIYEQSNEYFQEKTSPAKVTYYFNFKTDTNCGVHWIDDADYGGLIEYVPPEPVREGFTFGGWYKERECTNKWNLATDTLPKEVLYRKANVTIYEKAGIVSLNGERNFVFTDANGNLSYLDKNGNKSLNIDATGSNLVVDAKEIYSDSVGNHLYLNEAGRVFYFDSTGNKFYLDEKFNVLLCDKYGNTLYLDDDERVFYFDANGGRFYFDEEDYVLYQETKLFAKWIRK